MSSISSVSSSADQYQAGLGTNYKQIKADFEALSTALQSGKIGDAQQAFATLQSDDPKVAAALKQGSSATGSGATALNSLASALQSGDLAGAQQALTSLQQTRHGHHHHGRHAEPAATPAAAPSSADGSAPQTGLNALA